MWSRAVPQVRSSARSSMSLLAVRTLRAVILGERVRRTVCARGGARMSLEPAAGGELAHLAVFELDGAQQVVLAHRAALVRREEGGAESAVAVVAARQREPAGQLDEIEVARRRGLGGHVARTQLQPGLLVG